jgi:hypothetical protein
VDRQADVEKREELELAGCGIEKKRNKGEKECHAKCVETASVNFREVFPEARRAEAIAS